MQLFSLNVLGRSVAISMARISTAFPSSLLAFTKSPLHTMAHALPSLVGLVGKEEREREGASEVGREGEWGGGKGRGRGSK